MGFFSKYPYQDEHELNLDWLISQIRKLTEQLDNFVSLNTIKYADPIQWDITRQYMTNTVVIDGITGTAYLSTRPVPSGVMLTDPTYWTVIFTLDIYSVNENITKNNAGLNAVSTFPSYTGDWLLWNNVLYKVIVDIPVNTAYVVGTNLTPYSVDDFVHEYVTDLNNAITDVDNKIGELTDLNTTDQDSIVDAINEVLGNVGNLANLTTTDKDSAVDAINEVNSNVGDLTNLPTTDKSSIVNAIIELANDVGNVTIVTPEMYGAVGDGVTDDTTAVQLALNSGKPVYIKNTYLITPNTVAPFHHGLTVNSNTILFGNGTLIVAGTNYNNYEALYIHEVDNVLISGIKIVGDLDTHVGSSGEWGFGINVDDSSNVIIDGVDVSKCWGDGIYIAHLDDSTPVIQNKNIVVRNSIIHHNRRNNITLSSVNNVIIDGCEISHASGTSPQSGIDIEPDPGVGETVISCKITNCNFHDNATRSIAINHLISNDVVNVLISNNTFYDENEAINGYVAGGYTQWSLPLITNNVFRDIAHRVLNANNFACNFDNNSVYVPSSDEVLFVIAGASATFKNNDITAITTNALMFHIAGFAPTIENNTIYGQSSSYMFSIGGNVQKCSICNNTIPAFTGGMSAFIRTYVSNEIRVIGNNMSATNPPAYFIVCDTGYTHSTEIASFNNITFSSSAVSGGTFTLNANIINGTYTA